MREVVNRRIVKSILRRAAAAVVITSLAASAGAATDTWTGGDSASPTNFNDPGNWNSSAVPGAADIAYFNTGQTNQTPTLTTSTTVGELDFNTSGWMLGGDPNVLMINGVGGIGILDTATGTNEISAPITLGAAQTWDVATGGILQIDGAVSGNSIWNIGSAGYSGTVLLTAANSYSGGGLFINSGTLELAGANGALTGATALTLNAGGIFEINNTTAAGGDASGRLNSPLLDFNGGSFVYIGSDVAGTASSETLGAVNLNPGPMSVMTVTLPAANSSGSAQVTLGTISQFTPNATSSFLNTAIFSGSMLINGTNLGLTGGGSVITNDTSSLNLQGGSQAAQGSESVGTYNLQIAPFLLGESGLASGQGGTATGTPNTFLTYNGNSGFRPLNPTDEFAHSITDGSDANPATVNDNIYITSSQSAVLSNNNSINSLVVNGSGAPTLTIPSGVALTDSGGALLFVTSGAITGGTLDFGASSGANNDVNITVLPGQTATISSDVTGTGTSMSVAGGGSLMFGGNATFKNGIFANNATVTFANGWNPAGTNIYLLNAYNGGTFNFNGNSTIPASSNSNAMHMYMSGGTLNDNGSITFSNSASDFLVLHLGNNSVVNVGNPSGSAAASFAVDDHAGLAVDGGGGVGYFNIYPNATFSDTFSTTTGISGNSLRFGADISGAEIMNLYGTGNFFQILLADNSGSTAVNTLGAIYLQPGSTFTVARTNTSGNNIVDIGSAGNGNATNGQTNDFGYVSVPLGTSIGSGLTTTNGEPGEIDIAGSSRGAPLGGGNGVMDVAGGVVNIYEILSLGLSTVNQQFSELNIVNSGNTPGTVSIGTGGGGKSTIQMSLAANSGSAYGSYSVLNVVNSVLNNQIGSSTDAFPNNAINLAGTTTFKGTSAMNASATDLQTGILNIDGSSAVVQTNYVQSGAISVNGTSGQASSFLNFNGGTLKYNNYSSSTTGQTGFIAQSVGGVYIYANGAVLSGGVAGGGTINVNTGLFAPPGAGIQNITTLTVGNGLTSGGSGYLTPPVVYITDSTGFDATGYAVMNYTYNAAGDITGGSVASVVITNPGFNLTNPTITFVGGGGTGAAAAIPSADIASNAPPGTTPGGGLTVQAGNTTINLSGNFAGTNASTSALYSFTSSNGTLGVATPGSGLGNNPYASGTYYANTYPGIKNNTSTYTGPTVIETGTFQLTTATGSSSAQAGPFAATNNNIPFSPAIIVGDTANDSTAVLNITSIGGAGGFELAPGLINSTTYNNTIYAYTSLPQVLAGFGTVRGGGTSNVGLTVGLASGSVTATSTGTTSTGNNFGGYPFANGSTNNGGVITPTVNNSVIAPGYTANGVAVTLPSNVGLYQPNSPYGTIVLGANGGTTTVAFNTRQGNATSGPPNATGALTITGSASTATTSFGAGGTYYWKLDLTNAAAGATTTPGVATVSPGSTSGAPAAGFAWDELILDGLTVNSTIGASTSSGTATNAFTIQATDFSSQPGNSSFSNTSSYSWVIARVNQLYSNTAASQLLASLTLNVAGMPAPASGYQYFLSSQADPGNSTGAFDLVVNYAPVPEPTSLAFVGLSAGTLLLRRRRRLV